MNSFVFVAVLAVIVYFILMKSSFEIQSGIFIYQSPKTVYNAISDMNVIQRFQPFVVSTKLIKRETSEEGILTEYHTIEEHVPFAMNYTIPVIFDTKMEFTKPGEVLNFDYSVMFGTTLGHVTWKVEPRAGHHGPGAYLSYKALISCPWVTSSFTEQKAREAQDEILRQMRIALEKID